MWNDITIYIHYNLGVEKTKLHCPNKHIMFTVLCKQRLNLPIFNHDLTPVNLIICWVHLFRHDITSNEKQQQNIVYFSYNVILGLMSLVAHRFGRVDFRIFVTILFRQAHIRNLTRPNRWATKYIRQEVRKTWSNT